MNKRIRKKKHLGEFDVKAFGIKIIWNNEIQNNREISCDERIIKFQDDLDQYCRSICLIFGGSDEIFFHRERKEKLPAKHHRSVKWIHESCSMKDLFDILCWIQNRPEVKEAGATPLYSHFHGREEDWDRYICWKIKNEPQNDLGWRIRNRTDCNFE